MSDATDALRGWLAQLENPEAREASADLLTETLATARAEGYAKARKDAERLAEAGHARETAALAETRLDEFKGKYRHGAALALEIRDDIRAMREDET